MSIELRRPGPEDFLAMARHDSRAFGAVLPDEKLERYRPGVDLERFVVACDGGIVVGNGGAYTMDLTLPGGSAVPVSGVTWIAVSATHRRLGVMRAVMDTLVTDARERGEVAMALIASEGSIYPNVGYGAATTWAHTHIDPRRARFLPGLPDLLGIRYLDRGEVVDRLAPLHDRIRRAVPGEVSRPPRWWAVHGSEDPDEPTTHVVVVTDDRGDDQAYAAYRVADDWGHGDPGHVAHVELLGAATPEAHATLWRFLLSLDLVGEVRTLALPPDDPLPLLLEDPRKVRTVARTDGLWLRLLDIPAFFSARRYAVADGLVVEVTGSDESVTGRWRIEGDPEGGMAERTDAAPDLVTDAATLSAVALGGTSVVQTARAGRVGEEREGAVGRFARFLRWEPLPFCGTEF